MKPWTGRKTAALLLACLFLLLPCLSLPSAAAEEEAPQLTAQQYRTYVGVSVAGTLQAHSRTATALRFRLLEEPSRGTVELNEAGSFTYTPAPGKSGRDRFTVTAEDENGLCAAPVAVTVEIGKSGSVGFYADMEGDPAHGAALLLAERGIFVGSRVGEQYYFQPQQPVSRGEFLAMAMTMAKRETLENVMMTGFCDDGAIPVWAKGYVSAALKSGIVRGSATAEGIAFCSANPITALEAATLLDRILPVADASAAETSAVLPAWAAQAVANMQAVQVVSVGSFGWEALSAGITRAEAAEMLAAALQVLEENRQEQSFWDWLL